MEKLLFTVVMVAGAWFFLFKGRGGNSSNSTGGSLGRYGRAFGAARRAMSDSAKSRQAAGQSAGGESASRAEMPVPRDQAVELRPCPRCGTYVAVGTACTCESK